MNNKKREAFDKFLEKIVDSIFERICKEVEIDFSEKTQKMMKKDILENLKMQDVEAMFDFHLIEARNLEPMLTMNRKMDQK